MPFNFPTMPIPIPSRVVYDACQALNFSGAKELLKSPAHYQAYLNQPREETKALKVGKYVHALVLEPEVAISNFAVLPEGIDRRTKDGKAAYEAFTSDAIGKTILTLEEATTSERAAKTMLRIKNSLGVNFEFTEFMFTSIVNGVPVKCAIDAIDKPPDRPTDHHDDCKIKPVEMHTATQFLQPCGCAERPRCLFA